MFRNFTTSSFIQHTVRKQTESHDNAGSRQAPFLGKSMYTGKHAAQTRLKTLWRSLTINDIILPSKNGYRKVLDDLALQPCGIQWPDPKLGGGSYKACWRYPCFLGNLPIGLQLPDPLISITQANLGESTESNTQTSEGIFKSSISTDLHLSGSRSAVCQTSSDSTYTLPVCQCCRQRLASRLQT